MEEIFAKKSNNAFKQLILIFSGISALIIFLLYKVAQRIQLFADAFIHKLETACGCTQMSQLIAMHPFITASLAILSVFILIFVGFSIYKFILLIKQTTRFHSRYLARIKADWSAGLKVAVYKLGLAEDGIIEVGEDEPVVFCYGLLKPKVCLSSGLIKILKQDELQSVLLHENQHRLARDPLKFFIIKFLQKTFSFLPGLKTLANRYFTYSELAADEKATYGFTDRPRLARAIFKITQAEERHAIRDELAMSFFTSVIDERVNKLTDNDYSPQFKILGKGLAFGFLAIILSISATAIFLSDSINAFEMHNVGKCVHSESTSATCRVSSAPACGNQGEMKQQSCEAKHFSVDK